MHMTARELGQRMDSQELTEWIALTRYFHPLPDTWEQTGLLAASLLAPYSKEGRVPKAKDFIPTATPPRHESQDIAALHELKASFGD